MSARWVRPGGSLGALSEGETSLCREAGVRGEGGVAVSWVECLQKRLGSAGLWVGGSGTALVEMQILSDSVGLGEARLPSGGPGCTSNCIQFSWNRDCACVYGARFLGVGNVRVK